MLFTVSLSLLFSLLLHAQNHKILEVNSVVVFLAAFIAHVNLRFGTCQLYSFKVTSRSLRLCLTVKQDYLNSVQFCSSCVAVLIVKHFIWSWPLPDAKTFCPRANKWVLGKCIFALKYRLICFVGNLVHPVSWNKSHPGCGWSFLVWCQLAVVVGVNNSDGKSVGPS